MKKFFKKYKHLTSLLAVVLLSFLLFPSSTAFFVIGCWQLSQIAMSRRRPAACFLTVLSPEQIEEFQDIMREFGRYKGLLPALNDMGNGPGGLSALKMLPSTVKKLAEDNDALRDEVRKLRKSGLKGLGNSGVRWIGDKPFVSDDCALGFTGIYLACCATQGKWTKSLGQQDEVLSKAADWVMVQRAAIGSSDIPLPTIYIPQVIELVYKYGQFRQFATTFPLGAGTVNLPQLKPGEDAFGFIGIGTAGLSQPVPEKKVSAQNVTFTANKCGGIIRIPTEIEEDSFIPLGQFLARYVARRFAFLEDTTGFLGDGTATYANIRGVGPYISNVANTPQLQQLAAGKTKPSDATINDFRTARALVNAAVLQMGEASYYMHPSMEALLVTFNTLNQPLIYRPQQGNQPATLDGFPIRWVGAMQAYNPKAAPNAYLVFFGDLSYWYLGERGAPRVESSREVYFATDEIGMRALERIDVEAMAPDAMSAVQTAAA